MASAADLKRLVDSFDWDAWQRKVTATVTPRLTAIAVEQAKHETDAYDLHAFDEDDPFVDRFFTGAVGELITQITGTTKDRVIDELRTVLEQGGEDGMTSVAARVRDAVDQSAMFSPARALMISRTETANAYNRGAALAYHQNGVTHVEVHDGDSDEECAAADGEVWTVDEALDNPTEHPNCTRSFSPVIDEDEDEED